MSPSQFAQRLRDPVRPKRVVLTISTTLLIAVGTAAIKCAPLLFTTTSRFEQDSARRDTKYVRDSADHAKDDERADRMAAQLERLDTRVGAIYCQQIPRSQRDGCR